MALPSINGLPLTLGERADVPDAHVQDMGWRHDQGRRFQRCAYVHHHNPTLAARDGARDRGLAILLAALCLFAGRSAWLPLTCRRYRRQLPRRRIIWSGDRLPSASPLISRTHPGIWLAGRSCPGDSHLFDSAAKPMLPAAAIVSINGTERSNMAVADDFTLAYAAAAHRERTG